MDMRVQECGMHAELLDDSGVWEVGGRNWLSEEEPPHRLSLVPYRGTCGLIGPAVPQVPLTAASNI
jgi:hypothetical protein